MNVKIPLLDFVFVLNFNIGDCSFKSTIPFGIKTKTDPLRII